MYNKSLIYKVLMPFERIYFLLDVKFINLYNKTVVNILYFNTRCIVIVYNVSF